MRDIEKIEAKEGKRRSRKEVKGGMKRIRKILMIFNTCRY